MWFVLFYVFQHTEHDTVHAFWLAHNSEVQYLIICTTKKNNNVLSNSQHFPWCTINNLEPKDSLWKLCYIIKHSWLTPKTEKLHIGVKCYVIGCKWVWKYTPAPEHLAHQYLYLEHEPIFTNRTAFWTVRLNIFSFRLKLSWTLPFSKSKHMLTIKISFSLYISKHSTVSAKSQSMLCRTTLLNFLAVFLTIHSSRTTTTGKLCFIVRYQFSFKW